MKKRVFLPVLGLMWVLALVPTMMFSTDLSAQNEELQRRRDERNRLIEEQKQQVRDQAGEVYLRFFSAVEQNRAAHVKAMLKQGVDVESVDAYGTPALLVAARSGNNEVVEALLDAGADIERTSAVGDTALMLAAIADRPKTVALLLNRGARVNKEGWTPLHYAATGGNDAIVNTLIDYLADVDARSPNGTTPLMMAARENHFSTVKILLARGANPALKNDNQDSALSWANRAQYQEIVRALREAMGYKRRR